MTKAYLNALHEEGTRQDLMDWVVKLDDEVDTLREALAKVKDISDNCANVDRYTAEDALEDLLAIRIIAHTVPK